MVLRGTQFQRFGPAGCAFLTRRAFISYCLTFTQGQVDAVCLPQRKQMRHRRLKRFHGEISANNFTEDSRRMAREGDLCHGDIGESSSVSQPW